MVGVLTAKGIQGGALAGSLQGLSAMTGYACFPPAHLQQQRIAPGSAMAALFHCVTRLEHVDRSAPNCLTGHRDASNANWCAPMGVSQAIRYLRGGHPTWDDSGPKQALNSNSLTALSGGETTMAPGTGSARTDASAHSRARHTTLMFPRSICSSSCTWTGVPWGLSLIALRFQINEAVAHWVMR